MHAIILGIFDHPAAAASAARALRASGIARDQISVVTRNHDEEGALAEQMDATPGAEVEESRPAARLGEFSGLVLATIAFRDARHRPDRRGRSACRPASAKRQVMSPAAWPRC